MHGRSEGEFLAKAIPCLVTDSHWQRWGAAMIADSFRLAAMSAILVAGLASIALSAAAQNTTSTAVDKKLYCWDEHGQRICSDTLPPDAVDQAHDEFNARNGMRSAEIGKTLSAEEHAAAVAAEAQRRADEAAQQTRERTEQAMLTSYQNEAELRRVFSERIQIIDNNVRTARYNVFNLREGLILLLRNASEHELAGGNVTAALTNNIRRRHAELLWQQHLLASFERQRRDLDGEIEQTLQRYRDLKEVLSNR